MPTVGRQGALYVSSASVADSLYTVVGDIEDVGWDPTHGDVPQTNFDDGGFEAVGYGHSQATFTCTFQKEDDDAGQDIIRAMFIAKTNLYCRYQPYSNTGSPENKFTLKLDGLSESNAKDEVVKQVLTGKTTGSFTIPDQS